MNTCSLRWILTDREAARLAHDTVDAPRPWCGIVPWFARGGGFGTPGLLGLRIAS